jgi:hypothetical protein
MTELSTILDDHSNLANRIRLRDSQTELAALLRFDANLSAPVHRWFKFKESFSLDLVPRLLGEYLPKGAKSIRFLDPFCGVATSLLSAEDALRKMGVTRLVLRGVEVNPYIRFVAQTKMAWNEYRPSVFVLAGQASLNGVALHKKPEQPSLSTLLNPRFVAPEDLRAIIELREKVRQLANRQREANPLLVGIAAGAENVINLRKDGRALRFHQRQDDRDVHESVAQKWAEIAEDLQSLGPRTPVDARVENGDGRRADRIFPGRQFDVIFFSPPYLNNIDYTEVYKIELWLLKFLSSQAQMIAQRRKTFRSHPSCRFPAFRDADVDEVKGVLGPSFRRLLEYAGNPEKWRARLFAEYFADMLRTLRGCSRLLSPTGRIFLVIGNSLHGSSAHPIPVATDLWTCVLAKEAGLTVQDVLVGRQFHRKHFAADLLRESVLIMGKKQ